MELKQNLKIFLFMQQVIEDILSLIHISTSADGPFNLYQAICLACHGESYNRGVLALFKSCDHAAPSSLLCPIASSKVCKEFSTKDLAVSTWILSDNRCV